MGNLYVWTMALRTEHEVAITPRRLEQGRQLQAATARSGPRKRLRRGDLRCHWHAVVGRFRLRQPSPQEVMPM